MNNDTADQIYTLLVETCGAPERERLRFCHLQRSEHVMEWRFQGKLGFGGKFWRDGVCRVTCYPEDETPERRAMIEEANRRLKEFKHE